MRFKNLDEVMECFYALDHLLENQGGLRCLNCGKPLKQFMVGYYKHSDGFFVESLGCRVWIYAICPFCHYQNSLHKLLRSVKVRLNEREG